MIFGRFEYFQRSQKDTKAVSYTHLDVYKRQCLMKSRRNFSCYLKGRFCNLFSKRVNRFFIPLTRPINVSSVVQELLYTTPSNYNHQRFQIQTNKIMFRFTLVMVLCLPGTLFPRHLYRRVGSEPCSLFWLARCKTSVLYFQCSQIVLNYQGLCNKKN